MSKRPRRNGWILYCRSPEDKVPTKLGNFSDLKHIHEEVKAQASYTNLAFPYHYPKPSKYHHEITFTGWGQHQCTFFKIISPIVYPDNHDHLPIAVIGDRIEFYAVRMQPK